jgi:hypothetical protein
MSGGFPRFEHGQFADAGGMGCSPAGSHEVSPGKMRVAMRPGLERACDTAAAASPARKHEDCVRLAQWLMGPVNASLSDISGGSYFR